jgi:preprotein translocase subunit SecD
MIVAMLAAMFATGATSPQLGLDLQGGTSVVLQPRVAGGGEVTDEALGQAVDIIRQRVNGLGVTEADVQTQGDNIVVSVPGATNQEAVELIASTAQLRFRPVLQVGPPAPVPTPSPSPTGSASPSGTASPSPTSTGETSAPPDQNRAVPRALAKQGTTATPEPSSPEPSPTGTPTPTETAPVVPPAPSADVPPAVLREYERIDCTKARNRQGGGNKPTDEPIVACDRDGNSKYLLGPTAVEGTRIDDAQAGLRQNSVEWIVTLDFDGKGSAEFREVTTGLVGKPPPQNQFAIVLDNVVVSAPVVNEPITGGQAEISGDFTQQEARDLANVLRYGALPLTFDQGEVNTISASVGEDQLEKGILAGLIGLGLVVIYSILFYRALGIVSVFSLAVAALITWGTISLLGEAIGFALILAGVIGVIVSIGITADSFVVFFERLRDEIREGRSIRTSVEHGWVRARRTILVADAVTFLAAVVLYFLSIGRVQNFAFTLGLTTLIDVLVVFMFTKPLVTLLVRRDFFGKGHPLSGLNPERVGLRPRTGRQGAARPTAGVSARSSSREA